MFTLYIYSQWNPRISLNVRYFPSLYPLLSDLILFLSVTTMVFTFITVEYWVCGFKSLVKKSIFKQKVVLHMWQNCVATSIISVVAAPFSSPSPIQRCYQLNDNCIQGWASTINIDGDSDSEIKY